MFLTASYGMKKNFSGKTLATVLIIIAVVLSVYFASRKPAIAPEQTTPTVSPSVGRPPAVHGTAVPQPALRDFITSIIPNFGVPGTKVALNGKFSAIGNTVLVRAKDVTIWPALDIRVYNVGSFDGGKTLALELNPFNFVYGDCRAVGPFCTGRPDKLPPGEYYISVRGLGCASTACESNRATFTVISATR